jgi:hypothetical protein
MTRTITACPICGGDLQATEVREVWLNVARIRLIEGRFEVDEDTDDGTEAMHFYGEDTTERRIYCENDHTAEEMAEAAGGSE